MNEKETLSDRMKRYESKALENDCCTDMYVMLRLDGCHFHTWVKQAGLQKPFDRKLMEAMEASALALCKEIPTCVFAFTGSDEISLLLTRGEEGVSQPWHGNRIQKLVSIAASVCSSAFNQSIARMSGPYNYPPLAAFDCRAMFLPTLEECINCFIWRQMDIQRNSVSSLAQSYFSPKELNGKDQAVMKQMLIDKENVHWDYLASKWKNGVVVRRRAEEGEYNGNKFIRTRFFLDEDIPLFLEDKDFIRNAYFFSAEDVKN